MAYFQQAMVIPFCLKKWLFENVDSATKTKLLSDALLIVCSLSLQEIKEKSEEINQFFITITSLFKGYINLRENISAIRIPVDIKEMLVSCAKSLNIPQAEILRAALTQMLIEKGSGWEAILEKEVQQRIRQKELHENFKKLHEKERQQSEQKQEQKTFDEMESPEEEKSGADILNEVLQAKIKNKKQVKQQKYKYPYMGEYYAPVKWIANRVMWAKENGKRVCYNRYLEDAAYRYDCDIDELHDKYQEYSHAGRRNAKYRRSCYK